MKHNAVSHPAHYTAHPSGIECIQITEHMNFCLGNAVKYIWRAGLKADDLSQDLEKAKWYIERELKRRASLQESEKVGAVPDEVDSFNWIDYDGSGQPVSDDTLVIPMLRNGFTFESEQRAGNLSWSLWPSLPDSDIVKYRVVEQVVDKPEPFVTPEYPTWVCREGNHQSFPLRYTLPDDRIRVRLRSGERVVGELGSFQWEERDDENDIIAYQHC